MPGAENLYIAEFERLVTGKEVLAVVNLVVSSDTLLRTQVPIVCFQQIPAESKSPKPLFSISQRCLRQGRRPGSIEKWLKDNRVQCC